MARNLYRNHGDSGICVQPLSGSYSTAIVSHMLGENCVVHWMTILCIGLLFDFPSTQVTLTKSPLVGACCMFTLVGGFGGPDDDHK